MCENKIQQKESARVLQLLAQGLHPETCKRLDESDVLRDLSVVRAMFRGAEALRILSSDRKSSRQSSRVMAGKLWIAEEDLRLERNFEKCPKMTTLAKLHQRTRGSIRARLEKLGLIQDIGAVDPYSMRR